MNNADLPAMPLDNKMNDRLEQGYYNFGYGLTKLEYFAGVVMGASIANPYFDDYTKEDLADFCVIQAEALLKRLEKTK